jgi:arylsulfatase A-like enzyme
MVETKITRKAFLKQAATGIGAWIAGSALPKLGVRAARAQSTADRHNILFICMDQLRSWVDLPDALTLPAHARLREEGRAYRNYHVHQAPCGPSRSAFYTGQHIQKTGIYTNPPGEYAEYPTTTRRAVELPEGFPTIGRMLREQGYYTAYKGKWHLSVINQKAQAAAGAGRYPNATNMLEAYGFSDYNYDGEHTGLTWVGFGHDGVIAADSINLMHKLSTSLDGQPWFLAVNFVNPHDIMFFDATASGGSNRGTPVLEAPGTPLYEHKWDLPLPRSYYEDDLSTKPAVQRPTAQLDEEGWQRYQNYYFNCIVDVDRHVQTVLDAVDRMGLADNTIVVLTSDHGERGGAHGGMRGKGADIYKETNRVPLIIRHPDVQAGGPTEALASAIDLAPTLLSFSGLDDTMRNERYPQLHGIDVSRTIADPDARTERDERGILFNYGTPGAASLGPDGPIEGDDRRVLIRGIHDGRFKFGRYFKLTEHHKPRDWQTLVAHNDLELYDTVSDPDELVNLAYRPEQHRERILALNEKVNALIDREIGVDDGSIYPGPTSMYNTLKEMPPG